MNIYDMLMEDESHKEPYMQIKKNFKFYGLSNIDVIQDILTTGKISPKQYALRTNSSYQMNDAVYFTDDMARAFNWYATKRSMEFKENTSKDAFVFVIDPDSIATDHVYFDEMDFYIAILGIITYNISQLIQNRPASLTINTKIIDGKLDISVKTSAHSNKPPINNFWNKVIGIATDVVSEEANRYITPMFDVLRTFGVGNIDLFSTEIGKYENSYNSMLFRYNKPTSFNDALMMYNRLHEKDATFRKWVDDIAKDIINNVNPTDLYNKNVATARSFTTKYQRMLVKFVQNFCSSFAYKGELPIYGYFKGNTVTLSTSKAKETIYHISSRYLRVEFQAHSINDYMKQFNRSGLGITFKKYG